MQNVWIIGYEIDEANPANEKLKSFRASEVVSHWDVDATTARAKLRDGTVFGIDHRDVMEIEAAPEDFQILPATTPVWAVYQEEDERGLNVEIRPVIGWRVENVDGVGLIDDVGHIALMHANPTKFETAWPVGYIDSAWRFDPSTALPWIDSYHGVTLIL